MLGNIAGYYWMSDNVNAFGEHRSIKLRFRKIELSHLGFRLCERILINDLYYGYYIPTYYIFISDGVKGFFSSI